MFKAGLEKMDYTQTIADAAAENGVDPNLAIEVAIAESGLNPTAVSSAGAYGIMQLMPGTAAQYGVDRTDPVDNIQGGVTFLGDLLGQFNGDQAAALAAYNWGPTRVQNAMAMYGANWLAHAPAETRNYVAKILGNVGSQYSASIPALAPIAAAFNSFTVPSGYASLLPPPTVSNSSSTWVPVAIIGGLLLLVLFSNR